MTENEYFESCLLHSFLIFFFRLYMNLFTKHTHVMVFAEFTFAEMIFFTV